MASASGWAAGLGGLFLAAVVSAAEPTPHQLLDQMNEAVRLLDYEGRFVIESGDRLDALYIVHRVHEGAEKERVVALTGETREFIRSDEAVACLMPGRGHQINIDRPANGRSFSPLRGVSSDQLNATYRISMLKPARVAGRDADQLLIEPLDDLRFGYRLYLDRATRLPLRSVMFDRQDEIVSQMMFVELKVEQRITPIERDLAAMQLAKAESPDRPPLERRNPPAWRFDHLPAGFQLNVHRRPMIAGSNGELEHFIFSDGLATVSVYVQPSGGEGTVDGVSQRGAAQAVGRSLAQHEVIVVGEVPLKTLQWFASNIRATRP